MSHFLTQTEKVHLIKARMALIGMINSSTEDEYHSFLLQFQIHNLRGTSEAMERLSPTEPIHAHD